MAYNGPTGADAAAIVKESAHAWPGGYAMALVTSDGAELCHDCVNSEWEQIHESHVDGDTSCGWHPAGLISEADTDDEIVCDNCSEIIAPGWEGD